MRMAVVRAWCEPNQCRAPAGESKARVEVVTWMNDAGLALLCLDPVNPTCSAVTAKMQQ